MSFLKKMRKAGILNDLPPLTPSEQSDADTRRRNDQFIKAEESRRFKEKMELAAKRDAEYEVLCVNDTGKGDLFDEGLTYIAKGHAMKNIIRVCDRNGEWQECIESRFERVEAGNLAI